MTDQPPLDNRPAVLEQRQQRQDTVVAQIHEILLVVAQRQERTAAQLEALDIRLERNAAQVEANTIAIADLRAIIHDRFGNGQTPQ